MNIRVQLMRTYVFITLEYILKSQIAGPYIYLTFWEIAKLLCKMAASFYSQSISNLWVFSFLRILTLTCYYVFNFFFLFLNFYLFFGGTRASHCCGLSRCGAQAPGVQAQWPWLTGPATPRHVGSSRTGARTRVPCIGRRTLNHCATREARKLFLWWSFLIMFLENI